MSSAQLLILIQSDGESAWWSHDLGSDPSPAVAQLGELGQVTAPSPGLGNILFI